MFQPAHRSSTWLILTAALMFPGSLLCAQTLERTGGPADPSLNVQNFSPAPSPHSIFGVDAAQTAADLELTGGLILNYAKDPLVLRSSAGDEISVVENQLAADLLFAIGFFDTFEVGLDLPVYLINTAQVDANTIEGATTGDLTLRPKYALLHTDRHPLGLAFYADLTFPTGDSAAFTSSGTFSFKPGVIVDRKIGSRLLLAANLGTRIQEDRRFGDLKVGSELTFGVGAQYDLIEGSLLVGGELFGSTSFDDFFKEEETPLEGLLGLKLRTDSGFNFEIGAGGGMIAGYGSPTLRLLAGVRYADYDSDWDDDGIRNTLDECPRDPEDRDLFQDEDGCPEPDNDLDGVCDPGTSHRSCQGSDQCPLDPEDKDGFDDEDGCPDIDNDGDGFLDPDDKCPNVPGHPDFEGCPKPDKDDDGILDRDDQCPEDPEDKDNFQDEDGCPDTDNDNDGILDTNDACPDQPEDKDGFKDEDGCPDPDNDGDGIPDASDKCPDEAENYNGVDDKDGCPEADQDTVAEKRGDEIVILQKVFFDINKATIKERSERVLLAVANILINNKDIARVEVQGHTDDQGNDADNLDLSDRRAAAVRQFLIEQGVEPDRLVARGYGETSFLVPILDDNGAPLRGAALKEARDKNRRVNFKIMDSTQDSDNN